MKFQSQTKSEEYHDEMTRDNFLHWFTTELLPNLPHNALL